MSKVDVPDDAVVIVLTPKQARQFSMWLAAVDNWEPSFLGCVKPLPNTLISKLKAIRP
jgi:hypothetical protein